MREALAASPAPVVAVSPLVGGTVVKGPTETFMAWTGLPLTAAGVAESLGGPALLDGMVCDEDDAGAVPVLRTDVLMADAAGRRRLAEETLRFAEALR